MKTLLYGQKKKSIGNYWERTEGIIMPQYKSIASICQIIVQFLFAIWEIRKQETVQRGVVKFIRDPAQFPWKEWLRMLQYGNEIAEWEYKILYVMWKSNSPRAEGNRVGRKQEWDRQVGTAPRTEPSYLRSGHHGALSSHTGSRGHCTVPGDKFTEVYFL